MWKGIGNGEEMKRNGAQWLMVLEKCLCDCLNFTTERGDMTELKFWVVMSSISRGSVHMDYFTEICWLDML